MFSLERANASGRVGWWSLLGLILVPLLVAGGFLWATWGSTTRLDRVQAAVVNLDEPVKLNGQLVPLGRQLAGGLVTGGDEPAGKNFTWILTDATDAAAGVESGRYAAVVTIPKDFSARATSFSKTKADQISPAEITVRTSDAGGLADAAIGQAISTAATSTLNTELTKQYLDKIYVGFNDTGQQFTTVAKAAGELSDGTTKLSDGLAKSASGAGKFADGLDQLDSGAQQLAAGTGQLSSGAAKLADGLDQLADGTEKLPRQTRKLADGAGQLANGADRLSKGTAAYAEGTGENAAGLRSYAKGLQTYVETLNRFAKLPPDQLAPALQQLGIVCPFQSETECGAFYAGIVGGTQVAVAGLQDQPKRNGQPTPGTPTSCLELRPQKSGTTPGLLRGAAELCAGGAQLSSGASGLARGAAGLSTGTGKLATGTDKLADGLKPLAAGIGQSATGATKLSTGVRQLASGTQGLAAGTRESAAGAVKLSDGLDRLADGGSKLAAGSTKLADGLAKGAEKVPSFDKATRTKLAEVVATPVTQERPSSLFSNVSTTTFLAIIALWLGGLASFLILRAVPARALTSMKPAWRLTAEAFAPAAGIAVLQGLALSVMFQLLLGLSASRILGLTGLLVVAALVFAAVNQALVAWWGGIGRFVSVGLVVLAAAAALTSAVPSGLTALTPFLPLTPALEGARSVIIGGDGALGSVGMLLAWLILGAGGSLLAVARRRMLPAPALAVP